MAQAARTRVDQDDHLLFPEPESLRCLRVMDFFNVLHFQEMVAAAQRAELRQAAVPGALRNSGGIGSGERTARLGKLRVARLSAAVFHHPAGALDQNLVQLLLIDLDHAGGAGAAGDVAEDLVDKLSQAGADLGFVKGGTDEPDAAIHVEPHAARGNHTILHVHGRYSADGETVALVDIGHSQAGPHDAGQSRHVHRLVQRQVRANVIHQCGAGVDHDVGPHAAAGIARDAVPVRIDRLYMDLMRHSDIQIDIRHPAAIGLGDLELVPGYGLYDELGPVAVRVPRFTQAHGGKAFGIHLRHAKTAERNALAVKPVQHLAEPCDQQGLGIGALRLQRVFVVRLHVLDLACDRHQSQCGVFEQVREGLAEGPEANVRRVFENLEGRRAQTGG